MSVTSEALIDRSSEAQREQRPVDLTPRDRELFVHLAIARYLGTEQIRSLVFTGVASSVARRRLCRLSSGKHQYLRRLPYRTSEGPAVAWSLAPLGHLAALNFFRGVPEAPRHGDPGPEFIEQVVRLNQLYVGLAAAAKRKTAALDGWPFRWLPSDAARLPWIEFDLNKNSPAHRLICPDAIVELLGEQRRVFVEVENGLHALAVRRKGAPDRSAMKLKLERYTRFVLTPLTNLSNETYYLRAFPDGWPVELLYLVPTSFQRDAINEYVATTWRPSNEAVRLSIRALTFKEAPADFCHALKLPAEPQTASDAATAAPTLTRDEIRMVYNFYNGAVAAIAGVRQCLRSNPELAAKFPTPEYPEDHLLVKQICLRLAAGLRT